MTGPSPSRDEIARVMLDQARARGTDKTICPSEVARAIAGPDETIWRKLMKPVRTVAVELARAGQVVVMRKGRVVDPESFKGVYRIGLKAPERR